MSSGKLGFFTNTEDWFSYCNGRLDAWLRLDDVKREELAPVRAGDSVIARVTITDINQEKERVTLATMCSVGDTVVVEGEALIKVPRKPEHRG